MNRLTIPRILCLLLALLFCTSCFASCKKEETDLLTYGNQFDNKFDKLGAINPHTGEETLSVAQKYSSCFYAFSEGTLYFEATKSASSLVFVFYDKAKNYLGYQSFNDMTSGICAIDEDGYFRCYVSKDYDGLIYFSSNVPQDPIDYSYNSPVDPEPQERKLAIVNMGDSIFGNTQDGTSISATLQSLRGDIVYNFGLGGTTMSTAGRESGWEQLAFCSLVDAICTGDYSKQWEQLNSDTYFPAYFHTTIAAMEDIDWSQVDVLTVAYGTNDYFHENGLLFGADDFDTSTYIGAFRYAIRRLQQTYPHLRIIVITPIMRYLDNEIDADDHNQNGSGTLREYAESLKEAAKELRLPVIDAFSELSLSEYNREYYYQVDDGAHLNERGRRMYAALINGYIDLYCADLMQAAITEFDEE